MALARSWTILRITSLWLAVVLAVAPALPAHSAGSAPPAVAASVPPIHSLLSSVTAGVSSPRLLIPAGMDPHSYSLRASDVRALGTADLVVWVGPELETGLRRAMDTHVRGKTITLIAEPLIIRRTNRLSEDDRTIDPHIWLDPANARTIVVILVDALTRLDPQRAHIYAANGSATIGRIDDLASALETRLKPLREIPFVTFHDAYQYFESVYGLLNVGSVLNQSGHGSVGARHLAALRETVTQRNVRCVFAEPEFEPRLLYPVTEGTGIRTASLDHLGARVAPGPDAYFELMETLVRDLTSCLDDGAPG